MAAARSGNDVAGGQLFRCRRQIWATFADAGRIFQTAMAERGVNSDAATARGLTGIRGLRGLLRRLNP